MLNVHDISLQRKKYNKYLTGKETVRLFLAELKEKKNFPFFDTFLADKGKTFKFFFTVLLKYISFTQVTNLTTRSTRYPRYKTMDTYGYRLMTPFSHNGTNFVYLKISFIMKNTSTEFYQPTSSRSF